MKSSSNKKSKSQSRVKSSINESNQILCPECNCRIMTRSLDEIPTLNFQCLNCEKMFKFE